LVGIIQGSIIWDNGGFESNIWRDGSNVVFDGLFAQIKMLISLLVVWVNVKISAYGFVPPEKS
jgi:predicted Co/Zn/Cd cation transporter (cation efflux family)